MPGVPNGMDYRRPRAGVEYEASVLHGLRQAPRIGAVSAGPRAAASTAAIAQYRDQRSGDCRPGARAGGTSPSSARARRRTDDGSVM